MSEAGARLVPHAHSPLELVRGAAKALQLAGVDAPRRCAEKLLAHVLCADRAALYRNPAPVPPAATGQFHALVARRVNREPLQHLLGETEFWSLTIRCDRRALIPRPETELCVRAALDFLRGLQRPVVCDIGTGSGCIAVALAHERPDARVFASDISPEALALAAENLRRHGLQGRVTLLAGDLAQPFFDAPLALQADLVVCNPPYVAVEEIPTLQPEVRNHDPHPALCAGQDGLLFYRRLLAEFPPLLKRNGGLVIELGDGQAEAVCRLARDAGWQPTELIKDAASITRVLTAKRIDDG